MTWTDKFDLLRHILELFFYLVTGPLAAALTIRWVRRSARERREALMSLEQLARLAQQQPKYFQNAVVPFVRALECAVEATSPAQMGSGSMDEFPPEGRIARGDSSDAVDDIRNGAL
jgi:hypothetical protein